MHSVQRYAGASLALTGMLAVALVALSPTAAQAVSSQTFTADGTFNVPTGVTTLSVVVTGAGGGSAPSPSAAQPGVGGVATGSLAVTPGASVTVQVGGLGGTATTAGGSGGTHGGAVGGGGTGAFGEDQGGGGGGGYSAVLAGATVLAVGGGGGGSAMATAGGNGGAAPNGSGAAGATVTPGGGGNGGTQSLVGTGGVNTGCANPVAQGSAGSGQTGGIGGDGASGVPNLCFPDSASGGGGGGGGFFGGGGGGGGEYDPGNSLFGGGGGGGGSSYINPTFGTGTFSAAPTVAAGSVVISWSTDKTPQTLVGCGATPKKIAKSGKTRLTKAGCTTNAKQKVKVTASCKVRTRGDVGYCRLVRKANGKVSLVTYGRSLTITVAWSAPQTATYSGYKKVKKYKV